MGMPALKLDQENTVEESIGDIKERLVRVETTVEHIQDGVSELKAGVRQLDQKIESVEHRLLAKFDVVVQAIADLRVGQKNERVWYLLQLLGLLGVLAKAFKWI